MGEEDTYIRVLKNNLFPLLETVRVYYSGGVDRELIENLGLDTMPHLKEVVLCRTCAGGG